MILEELYKLCVNKTLACHSDDVADSTTFVGIEVEVEGLPEPPYIGMWIREDEGSLHNHGIEYVTQQPLAGAVIVEALDLLQEYLVSERPLLSKDCSLHVHIDVSDLTVEQCVRFINLAFLLEPLLADTYYPDRADNVFCQQYANNASLAAQASRRLIAWLDRPLMPPVLESRYAGVNVNSCSTLGTVEFRGHGPTYNKDTILEWVNVLIALKTYAKNLTSTPLREYLLFKGRRSESIIDDVFGVWGKRMQSNVNKTKLIQRGVVAVRGSYNLNAIEREAAPLREQPVIITGDSGYAVALGDLASKSWEA